jgi:hypothetical protein
MKSQTQTIVLLVAIAGLVGVVAYVRNSVSIKAPPKNESGGTSPESSIGPEPKLEFPVTVVEGAGEFEIHEAGHFDFHFLNSNPEPVEMGFQWKSCKCAKVEAMLVPAETHQAHRAKSVAASASLVVEPVGRILNLLALAVVVEPALQAGWREIVDRASNWQTLMDNDAQGPQERSMTVPAKTSGIVRMSWTGERLGPQRLVAKLWVQWVGDPKSRGGDTSLEVPIVLVPPLRVQPDSVTIPDLRPNQSHDFEFLCWSSTRPSYKIESVQEESGSKCFRFSTQRLQGEELKKASETLNKQMPTRALCVYRVTGTAHERLPDGQQLDLGPFSRRILVKSDIGEVEPLAVKLKGTVRGEIRVGADENRDKVDLKSFEANQGTRAMVILESERLGFNLSIKDKSPAFLDVQLERKPTQSGEVGQRWALRVTVPPRLAFGELPPESAIILVTDSQPPRQIRIPVVGRGKVGLGTR